MNSFSTSGPKADETIPGGEESEYLSTTEAARLLRVSLPTIHHWAQRGVLRSWKTPGGQRRIASASVDALLRQQRRELTPVSTAGFSILLVEDDQDQVALFRQKTSQWRISLELLVAGNGFDGLILAERHKPDLLVVDLLMPGMDGFRMIRELRDEPILSRMRVVVVTSLSQEEIDQQGGLPASVPVFRKPLSFPKLKGVIESAMAERALAV
ncbi:MAG: response regulator [Magnetococcales bacterium]|nr:response regulator [Magnetococcales bacterium]